MRAFVKIQDGCSFSCAFCVIPLVRGASRSRSADAVLAEIRKRVAQGHREVVLTGINLGCFRDRGAGHTLATLVRAAGATPGLERLRLSSIEINHVDAKLIAALRETPTVVAPPSRPVAVRRRRRSPRDGAPLFGGDLPPAARAARGDYNLTSDVIVGFPAENDDAFDRTLRTVERAGLTKVHVFPYSPRPGTATAAADAVPPRVKKERGARLRALATSSRSGGGTRRSEATTSSSSTGPVEATATTTRRSSWTRRWALSCRCAPKP